uniref:30S ribosomal protein S20 n=1 Tax=Analipus japonicus TaxID=31333 RepID=UPI002E79C7F5|nr:30S ribosomal protein S20 [Analipus japonicus]WAM61961.1 30S ribosomal protein S20 [Analipus japonicus]
MANTKSSKKRIRINRRNRTQNNSYKSIMKSSKKEYLNLFNIDQPKPTNINKNTSTSLSFDHFMGLHTKKFTTLPNKYFVGLSTPQLSNSNNSKLKEAFAIAVSKIDKAVKKKIIHKNTGARKKSNLSKHFYSNLSTI